MICSWWPLQLHDWGPWSDAFVGIIQRRECKECHYVQRRVWRG